MAANTLVLFESIVRLNIDVYCILITNSNAHLERYGRQAIEAKAKAGKTEQHINRQKGVLADLKSTHTNNYIKFKCPRVLTRRFVRPDFQRRTQVPAVECGPRLHCPTFDCW